MIRYISKYKIFKIDTKNSSYMFGITNDKLLYHIYWGKLIKSYELLHISKIVNLRYCYAFESEKIITPEIDIWDSRDYFESCVKVSFSSNDRIIEYEYISHKILDEKENKYKILKIVLKDKKRDFYIILFYKIIYEYDIIERWIKIETNENVVIEKNFSASLNFVGDKWYVGYLSGCWAKENEYTVEQIQSGKKIIESRTGSSSHYFNPFFLLSPDIEPMEEKGVIYFGELKWSGNWKFIFEKTYNNVLKFLGGINSFDTKIILRKGETFTTPSLLLGISFNGLGEMSRKLHKYQQNYLLPKKNAKKIRPILFNTWEAVHFDLKEENLIKIVDKAEEIGVELFVIDDGWFKNRVNDTNGLGEWKVDKNKFPWGLNNFIKYVNKKGMKFGIWIEPEMISAKSQIYKKHPDWVYNFEGRRKTEIRNQLVLNLTKKEVVNFLKSILKELLTHYNIEYIKWDYNRYITEPGIIQTKNKEGNIWIEHIQNLYKLKQYIRELKPNIIIEGCSGGGGRYDAGILEFVDQIWTSDNTDALSRQFIQWGTLLAYSPITMGAHVTDVPNKISKRIIPLSFRFHTAMLGNFGIEADILKWSENELKYAKKMIYEYKKIRRIIQLGYLYRIFNPFKDARVVYIFVSLNKKKGVLFVFQLKEIIGRIYPNIKIRGLNENYYYKIRVIDGIKEDSFPEVCKGEILIRLGLPIPIKRQFESCIINFEAL